MHPVTPTQVEMHSMFHQNFVPGFSWMPDGNAIVLSQGGKLRRVNLADGVVATIPFEARFQRTMSEQNRPRRRINNEPFEVKVPRWLATSPERRHASCLRPSAACSAESFPDGTPRRFGGRGDLDTVSELSPAWAPDGSEIAFATWNDAEGGHVWKVAAEGGKPCLLTHTARRIIISTLSGAPTAARSWC